MANQIKMATTESIITLYERGWSRRRIARELGLDRETVGRHIRLRMAPPPKPAIPPAGISESVEAKPAIPPAGKAGRSSQCMAFHKVIAQDVEAGLSAQSIFQDLRCDYGFAGAYDSVKRYVRRLGGGVGAVARVECLPGESAQVDFGLGAPIVTEGHRRRSWVFRIVLSHSRKGYSEAVLRQGTEEFIRCLENAFRYFGGAPKTLVIDNLRAAVSQADWYEPELQPKMAAFCRHYGTVALPTRPRHPEHKGKVERGIGYVKGNALKRRSFGSLADENAYLRHWEEHVADQRVHGTTRQHVGRCFAEHEREALLPLPAMVFPSYEEGKRAVHRDSRVEVKHSYYRVPVEYIGREVWVRWDGRMVRIFNQRMELIATHVRLEPGHFSPAEPGGNDKPIAETADYWLNRVSQIGPACDEWAQRLYAERGIAAIRVFMGLCHLGRQAGRAALERACRRALEAGGGLRLRHLRRLLEESQEAEQLTFLQRHPLIRDLGEYGALVAVCAAQPELPTAAPLMGQERPRGATVDNSCDPARAEAASTPKETP
jgi:transposase